MRCPQCGCSMEKTNNCPYCDISKEQVYFASNKKAKELLKKKQKDKVCYSSVKPRDVDRIKFLMLTLFLGFVGAGNFYVGRRGKGLFCCLSTVIALVVYFVKTLFENKGYTVGLVNIIAEVAVVCATITVLFWVVDLLSILLNIYKYPVVVPDREEIEKEVDLNVR